MSILLLGGKKFDNRWILKDDEKVKLFSNEEKVINIVWGPSKIMILTERESIYFGEKATKDVELTKFYNKPKRERFDKENTLVSSAFKFLFSESLVRSSSLQLKKVYKISTGTKHVLFTASTEPTKIYGFGSNTSTQLSKKMSGTRFIEKPMEICELKDTSQDLESLDFCARFDSSMKTARKNNSFYFTFLGKNFLKKSVKLKREKKVEVISFSVGVGCAAVSFSDGLCYTFGDNSFGQLGNPFNFGKKWASTHLVNNNTGLLSKTFVKKVSCGKTHFLFLTKKNEVYTSGQFYFQGQRRDYVAPRLIYKDPSKLVKVLEIEALDKFSILILSE